MILTCWIGKRSSLSFTPSFILFMKSMRIGIMFIISILMTERARSSLGRLKTLMLKCPHHGLPKDMIITNFYARLSRQDKDLLDASSMGSFTNKKIDAKWELLERIQRNTEDWEIDKGKESGIIYEYDCIKSFVETASFNKFSAKFGLDSQLLVDFLKSFASHLNMPKENWIKHHEPFKEICKENEIVNDDCNM